MPVDRYAHAPGRAKQRAHRVLTLPTVGQVFGQWTVTGATRTVAHHRVTPVRCSCGVQALARLDSLHNGRSWRCVGCGKRAARAKLSAAGRAAFLGSVPKKAR